jgi:hypothetical protein
VDINECFLISREYYKMSCKCFNLSDNSIPLVELLPEESRPAELIKSRDSTDLTNSKYKIQLRLEKRETPVIDARQFYTNKSSRIRNVRYQS